MQTNILGPENAPYVICLTDLEEITKKGKAILLACLQNYYEESIHRLALALSESPDEDEMTFFACILTQFYHKAGIELPEILLDIANDEAPIEQETHPILKLFLLQIDKGFRGLATDGIPVTVKQIAENRIAEATKKLGKISSNDRDHIKLAILADELSKQTRFSMALRIFKMAEEAKSDYQYVDFDKWKSAKIFADAYKVGALINRSNSDIPQNDIDMLNLLHEVIPLRHLEIKERLRKEKEEQLRQKKQR
jgi:hypothetical protein